VAVEKCYQCGKCTAGCPMAAYMDLSTNQVMRLCQIGDAAATETLLKSSTIWLCASCLTCTQRCPRELDPAAVMDVLRERSHREGKASPVVAKILAFHKAFLATVRRSGRMHEFDLVRRYKLTSFDLFSDMALAPAMMLRGKLHLTGGRIRGHKEVERIFDACGKDGPK